MAKTKSFKTFLNRFLTSNAITITHHKKGVISKREFIELLYNHKIINDFDKFLR